MSSISLAEIVYLIEKNRLPLSAYDDLKLAMTDPRHVLKEAPSNVESVDTLREVPRVGCTGHAGPHRGSDGGRFRGCL